MVSIEDLSVVYGYGYDINLNINDKPEFISVTEFISIEKEDEAGSDFSVGKGYSVYESSQNYRARQNKPYGYGSELIYLISEERARFGIEDVIIDLLRYADVNPKANVVVCKGKCEDYFSMESKSGSASETLSQLIDFAHDEYFFSRKNTLNDLFFMYYQQGRQIYLPYIEIKEGLAEITGVAVFKDRSMVRKVDIHQAKLLNLLRASGGTGVVTVLTEDPHNYIEFEGESESKVKVSLENDKLNYDISVNISGFLSIETIFKEELKKDQIEKIEKILAKNMQVKLESQIKKIQTEYRMDCLDITKYAISKYGRDSGYDSDKYFTDANIKVKVEVNISSVGRVYGSIKKE